jgi:hypothetical protein
MPLNWKTILEDDHAGFRANPGESGILIPWTLTRGWFARPDSAAWSAPAPPPGGCRYRFAARDRSPWPGLRFRRRSPCRMNECAPFPRDSTGSWRWTSCNALANSNVWETWAALPLARCLDEALHARCVRCLAGNGVQPLFLTNLSRIGVAMLIGTWCL